MACPLHRLGARPALALRLASAALLAACQARGGALVAYRSQVTSSGTAIDLQLQNRP